MAQSLVTSGASPWFTYYAAIMNAASAFAAAAGPAQQAWQTDIANADAGIDTNGNPTGGGQIAIDDKLRDEEIAATATDYADALTAADAARAATTAQVAVEVQTGPPTLEAAAPGNDTAIVAPDYASSLYSGRAFGGGPPGSGFTSSTGTTAMDSGAALGGATAAVDHMYDGPGQLLDLPTDFGVAKDKLSAPSDPIQVQDARKALQGIFGKSSNASTIVQVIAPDGIPVLVAGAPESGLPDGVNVDPQWTKEEVARVALTLALGGKLGPMTVAQEVDFKRYQSAIERQRANEYTKQMQFGQRRDAMVEELQRRTGIPTYTPTIVWINGEPRLQLVELRKDYPRDWSKMSYAELREELGNKLGDNVDVDDWINAKIAREYFDWLQERLGTLTAYDDQQRVVLDVIQFGLDVGGFFDPTPFTDGLSTIESIGRVQPVQAGISIVAMLPWLGDSAKVLKIPHYIETLRALVRLVVRHPEVATLVQPVLRKIKAIFEVVPWDRLAPETAEKWHKLYEELADAVNHIDAAAARHADDVPSWTSTPGFIGKFARRRTPWGREVWMRGDIDWSFKRSDGLTNIQAAQEGFTPRRVVNGIEEKVTLHHLNQDVEGGLVEVWRPTHSKVKHNVPPPSWRKLDPAAAEAFDDLERPAYWIWRAKQLGG